MAKPPRIELSSEGNRLRTPLPKIGIRPVIDGRYGGVRESLEAKTMDMAEAVSIMIQALERPAGGGTLEVVIADTCIGGLAEAAECEEKFAREGVGVSLTVTPCWCYGSETMDMHPTRPKAIWGFNGTERPGAVYLAAALAAHNQKGLPCFGIYGREVQDAADTKIPEDVQLKIRRFVRAGLAVATMKGTSYLSIGGTSMGIAGSIVDVGFFERYLGMRVMAVDMSEFLGRIKKRIYDETEYNKAMLWVQENCAEGEDWNPADKQRGKTKKREDWETSVKMTLIARDLMVGNPRLEKLGFKEQAQGHNALIGGFQGQRQWTDYYPNGDFMEAILNSSFDWNGIRAPYVFATENDSLNAVSMLFGNLLRGSAQLFSDVRTYWSFDAIGRVTGANPGELAARIQSQTDVASQATAKSLSPSDMPDGVLHLINSGPSALDWTGECQYQGSGDLIGSHDDIAFGPREALQSVGDPCVKFWMGVEDEDVRRCLAATKWCPSMTEYFPGGGWSTDFTTRGGMPATMCRLNLVAGLGPVLQIAEGWTVSLPDDVHKVLEERTNPTWPTTWFVPRLTGVGAFSSVYSVMSAWGANHCAVCYDHIGADLITLASMLRIPVDMHNVSDVFRPSAWTRFGTADPESADYRACGAFGPLYG